MYLAVRGSRGLYHACGPPDFARDESFPADESKQCKVMAFSPEGNRFVWNNGTSVTLVTYDDASCQWRVTARLPESQRTVYLKFSPRGTVLASWEVLAAKPGQATAPPNLRLWSAADGSLLFGTPHRKADTWEPQWTEDESLTCLRSPNGEAIFYEDMNFQTPQGRLSLPKLESFRMSPRSAKGRKAHVVAYIPGQKGGPGFGKLFGYPRFHPEKDVLASKSFMTADAMEVKWSFDGQCALLLTQSDVDKTGGSYYGKTQLHFVDVDGDTALVDLPKDGPVYSVKWCPSSPQFVVVYGYMPAKATLFNKKLRPVYDFGTGPRNVAMFNPQGNLLLLGGFGNLRGHIEVWDVAGQKKASQFEAADATALDWSPDGQLLAASTCAPRLRMGNGHRIFHYTSTLLHETRLADAKVCAPPIDGPQVVQGGDELWEVVWRPAPRGAHPSTFKVETKPIPGGITPQQPQASKQAYRPPMARGKPSNFRLHDDDEAPQGGDKNKNAPLSKSAAKNKKRREAKQQQQEPQSQGRGQQQQTAAPPPKPVQNAVSKGQGGASVSTGDAEKDKKLRKLNDKLTAIQKLKQQQSEGKKLEANQLEKISKEGELLAEMKALQL